MSGDKDEDGPFKVPEDFGADGDALPKERTDERIKRALEEGAVEVSEDKRSHTFVRQATEDTSDDSWGGGIIGAMYGSDDPSEEEPKSEEPAEAGATKAPDAKPGKPPPDLHALGSTDSNNPIQFIDSPLGEGLLDMPGDEPASESTPAPSEPLPPELTEGESEADDPSAPGGESFFAELGLGGEASPGPKVPDEAEPPAPEPVGEEKVDFFSGAPQPPTEEVPSAIFDDVSQPSAIPSMSGGVGYEEVPEEPVEEVVIGAPTPSPILREVGASSGEDMPDLRARLKAQADARAAEPDDDDDSMGLPVLPILVLVGLLVALSGVGYFLYSLASGPDAKRAEQAAISTGEAPHVGLPAVTLPDVMKDGPREIPDEGWTDAMAVPVEAEADDGRKAPAPPPTRVERPAPAPKAGVAGLTSRITITSNRRAMIALDGTPHGYAPLDIKVGPGEYALTATIPGRADTEQTKTIKIGKDQTKSVGFVF